MIGGESILRDVPRHVRLLNRVLLHPDLRLRLRGHAQHAEQHRLLRPWAHRPQLGDILVTHGRPLPFPDALRGDVEVEGRGFVPALAPRYGVERTLVLAEAEEDIVVIKSGEGAPRVAEV